MSRGIATILTLVILLLGCDTKDTVKPRNENFFIKYYAGVNPGDQEGAVLIETSDGGLLIAGTSYNEDGSQEILVIKTSNNGNTEWIQGYGSIFGNDIKSEAKAIVEVASGYVIGGNITIGDIKNSVFYLVDFSGNYSGVSTDMVQIKTDTLGTAYTNTLSSLTIGPSGLLVSGTTERPTYTGGIGKNGFYGLYSEGLIVDPVRGFPTYYFGLTGDEQIVGGYEIKNPNNVNPAGNNTRFMLFGSTTSLPAGSPGSLNFFYYGLTEQFLPNPGMGNLTTVNNIDDQEAYKVKELNDRFWVVGSSGPTNAEKIFSVGWRFRASTETGELDWIPFNTGIVSLSNNAEIGKSLFPLGNDNLVVVGDINFTNDHSEIAIATIDATRNAKDGWPKSIGNSSSTYKAADVIVLSDGSIVTLGTADLEPIRKIVVIKSGPNGEMSFDE